MVADHSFARICYNISRTEHASAVTFHKDYEKNMSSILAPKSQKLRKKIEGMD